MCWCFLAIFSTTLLSCGSGQEKAGMSTLKDKGEGAVKTRNSTELNVLNFCTEMPDTSSKSIRRKGSQAGGLRNALWPENHRTLAVKFLNGDSEVIRKVITVAKEWEQFCSIRFNFESTEKADITISFLSGGSWSCIGRQSRNKVPSMNFGWLSSSTSDANYHRTVLHEFGHALGLIHEHQNPSQNPIQWNKDAVYAYYADSPYFWDKSKVEINIFKQYEVSEMTNSDFDSSSIMLYAVPKELTTNGYSTGWNSQLSENDKRVIGIIYPQQ